MNSAGAAICFHCGSLELAFMILSTPRRFLCDSCVHARFTKVQELLARGVSTDRDCQAVEKAVLEAIGYGKVPFEAVPIRVIENIWATLGIAHAFISLGGSKK